MIRYLLCVAFLSALLIGSASAGEMKDLVFERCLSCHDMEKVCVVKSNNLKWWKESTQRMVGYQKDLLTTEEVDAMSKFLAAEANRKTVCVQ